MNTPRSQAMTKQEISILMSLVESNIVVNSRKSGVKCNRLKNEAWQRISDAYNATMPNRPRNPSSLRHKFKNLRMAARKRAANLNDFSKEGMLTPRDDILDRMITIIDTESPEQSVVLGDTADPLEICVDSEDSVIAGTSNTSEEGGFDSGLNHDHAYNKVEQDAVKNTVNPNLVADDMKARINRNIAIAEYYILKKRILELNMKKNNC